MASSFCVGDSVVEVLTRTTNVGVIDALWVFGIVALADLFSAIIEEDISKALSNQAFEIFFAQIAVVVVNQNRQLFAVAFWQHAFEKNTYDAVRIAVAVEITLHVKIIASVVVALERRLQRLCPRVVIFPQLKGSQNHIVHNSIISFAGRKCNNYLLFILR